MFQYRQYIHFSALVADYVDESVLFGHRITAVGRHPWTSRDSNPLTAVSSPWGSPSPSRTGRGVPRLRDIPRLGSFGRPHPCGPTPAPGVEPGARDRFLPPCRPRHHWLLPLGLDTAGGVLVSRSTSVRAQQERGRGNTLTHSLQWGPPQPQAPARSRTTLLQRGQSSSGSYPQCGQTPALRSKSRFDGV